MIFVFLLFPSIILAKIPDTLNYFERFNIAVKYYNDGRYKIAEKEFNFIYSRVRDYRDPAAQLLIAKAQNMQGLWDKAKYTCKSILKHFPDSPYEADIRILLGDIAFTQGKTTLGFQNYLMARPLVDDLLYINDIDNRIYNCIAIGLEEQKLQELLFREKNVFNRAIIHLAQSYQQWIYGNVYDIETHINKIDTFYLPGRFANIYGKMKTIRKENMRNPVTIAVIVPLTGVKKDIGLSYILGLSEYLNSTTHLGLIRYLIYDTVGLGVNSLKIITDINRNKNITAVLGPLTDEEVFILAGFNSQLPILIPKSAPPGLSELADNLFFLSPSLQTIAERTAQMMIKELGLKNIAVLSPGNDDYKLATEYFLNECYQLGIDPVAVEWYIEKPVNLSRQLKNIRRRAWELMPEQELSKKAINLQIDSLDALFDVDVVDFFKFPEEEEKINKKDSAKIILETIQALYIPIRPDELTYIGTQLPFYNLKMLVFGNENWLDMKLLNQKVIGPHVQGMKIISDVGSALSINNDDTFLNLHSLAIEHSLFLQSIVEKGFYTSKQFKERLRNSTVFYGEKVSIQFIGNKNNENGYVQVLEYSKNSLNTLGIYDGETFSNTSE